MKTNFRHNVINLFLLFSILSHLTLRNNFFQNYVLCYGTDGHVAIEKVNECYDCSELEPVSSQSTTDNLVIKKMCCEDISLDENCLEDIQFLPKEKVFISNQVLKLNYLYIEPKNENFEYYNFSTKTENLTLANHTTVSLLI